MREQLKSQEQLKNDLNTCVNKYKCRLIVIYNHVEWHNKINRRVYFIETLNIIIYLGSELTPCSVHINATKSSMFVIGTHDGTLYVLSSKINIIILFLCFILIHKLWPRYHDELPIYLWYYPVYFHITACLFFFFFANVPQNIFIQWPWIDEVYSIELINNRISFNFFPNFHVILSICLTRNTVNNFGFRTTVKK